MSWKVSSTARWAMAGAMPAASMRRFTRRRPRLRRPVSERAIAPATRTSSRLRSALSRATAASMASSSWPRRARRCRTCASDSSRTASIRSPVTYGSSDAGRGLAAESRDFRSTAALRLSRARHLLAGHVGGGRDALDLQLELVHVRRPAQGLLVGHEALLVETEDRLVERLHAVLRRPLGDGAVNEVRLLLVHDAVADECRADEDLDGGYAAAGVDLRNQALGDDGLEDAGELNPDLLLLVRREDGNDAVDRFGGVERVQRRKDQVARFGGEQRRLDRLEVAHLADQDDIRILPQRAAQRVGERS